MNSSRWFPAGHRRSLCCHSRIETNHGWGRSLEIGARQVRAIIERIISETGEAGRERDAGQAGAESERILPDIGNAVADDEVGQAAVGSERLAANAGDTVGDCYAGQGAAIKRLVPNADDVVANGEAGQGQLENAESPMLVTPLPMVALVRPTQSANATTPMERTLSGIVTLARFWQ